MMDIILELIKNNVSPIDIVFYIIVVIVAGRSGWVEFRRRKGSPYINIKHVLMISDIEKLIEDKNDILYRRVLTDQKRVCEASIEATVREMKDTYFKEMVKKGVLNSEVMSSIDYKHYCAVSDILGHRLAHDLKIMMKENGLHKRDETQMRLYIQSKFEKLVDMGAHVFDTYYGGPLLITRSEVHDLHYILFSKFRQRFEDTIRECRDIDIKGHAEVDNIDAKLEDMRRQPCANY